MTVPPDAALSFQQGLACHQQGRPDQAAAFYQACLQRAPGHADAWHCYGVLEIQLRRFDTAATLLARAAALIPGDAAVHANLGTALYELKRHAEALTSYDRALALDPGHIEALYGRATLLVALDRPQEALAGYDAVLAAQPGHLTAHYARGTALRKLGRAVEALAAYDRALALRPDYADAWSNRGNACRELRRLDEALACYDRALALRPGHFEAQNNRGTALLELGRPGLAAEAFDRVLAAAPDHAEALSNRGMALLELNRFDAAADDFARALAIDPALDDLLGELLYSRLFACDWRDYDEAITGIAEGIQAGKAVITPFIHLILSDSAADQQACAAAYNRRKAPAAAPALWRGERYRHDRIRLAYLSADFHNHATAHLMAGLFEAHDRSSFEITALSFGRDTGDAYRRRLSASFERFVDVRARSDREVAQLMRDLEIDIAIDLKGYTQNSRMGIFACRPAPIQVSHLGYPGTTGAPYMDYILADRLVIPAEHRPFFTEQIVYLPDSYQPNDAKRRIEDRIPTRREAGLPETGFVFCCFNGNYKIVPRVFDVWMRLLHQVEGSVLWLLEGSPEAARNLRQEAERRGIPAGRLVFAPRVEPAAHLARHLLAGLFLDTLPCNAHTTASDALWAGLPVLTCLGGSFAGRVAASLLHAVGLPELVTNSLEEYEALALGLARDPAALNAVKTALDQARSRAALFDTDRYRRHFETACRLMWERWQRGEPPAGFAVTP